MFFAKLTAIFAWIKREWTTPVPFVRTRAQRSVFGAILSIFDKTP